MNPIIQKRYDKAGPRVAAALSRRNMEAFYCPTAIEGVQKVLELIAPEDVVSWGGAMTADEMNLKELLRRRGQPVIDRDTAATPQCSCAQIVVTRFSMNPNRIKVVLVGENLGL